MFIELLFFISFLFVLFGFLQIHKIRNNANNSLKENIEKLAKESSSHYSPRPQNFSQNLNQSQRTPPFRDLRKNQDKLQHCIPADDSACQHAPIDDVNKNKNVQEKLFSFRTLRVLSEKCIPKRSTNVEVRNQDQIMTTSDELRNRICRELMRCEIIGKMKIYHVNLKQVFCNQKYKFRKLEFGQPNIGTSVIKDKVILLVGATGSGKSTLINSMINYVFGVEFEDNVRFKLVIEGIDSQQNQAQSQTTWITAYTIHHQKEFKVNYNLTIIDTPGFGDTKGIKRDAEIMKQIKAFLTAPVSQGIGHINAVGIVAQSSLPRLTITQKYIFDQILALFGKDIGENIYLMLTFADGRTPQVLNGIDGVQMPYKDYFKFNNSVIFEDSSTEDELSKMFWKMGMKSFDIFFNLFPTTCAKSLTQTKLVLEERERIETQVEGLQFRVKQGLNKLEYLKQLAQIVKQHNADITRNKNFTYEVEEDSIDKHDLEPNTYVTNCLICNFTCHPSCGITNDGEKYRCSAMDAGGKANAHCKVCRKGCHWMQHRNMGYYFTIKRRTVKKTFNQLKERYQDANGKVISAQMIVHKVESEYETVQAQIIAITEELRKSINKLNK
ncbi:hypothetical protein LOD99_11365, partial [Oopsacas minuta]